MYYIFYYYIFFKKLIEKLSKICENLTYIIEKKSPLTLTVIYLTIYRVGITDGIPVILKTFSDS